MQSLLAARQDVVDAIGGLQLMRQRVKDRSGEILVRSDGSGTTIHVQLPILTGPEPSVA